MKSNILSARKVESLSKRGFYCDGGGLYLQVSKTGSKSWVFRYLIHDRIRDMGLGSIKTFSLAEAREIARICRQRVSLGYDPLNEKQAERDRHAVETAKRITFAEVTDKYWHSHRDEWTNEKHAADWRKSVARFAFPVLGELPVDQIEIGHITKVLEPIWKTKNVTASRVRQRIEVILGYATVNEWRHGDNPARWDGHLETILSDSHVVKSHKAMKVEDMPAFMAKVRKDESIEARALELLILTGTRRTEALEATWGQFDMDAKTWTIPAERMKAGKEHTIPLSGRVLEILNGLPQTGPRVFTIGEESTRYKVKKLSGDKEMTVHGFRSTFRDWAGDQTNFDREVIEHAMAHQLPDKAEASYRRGTALQKRRLLMEAWAGYCSDTARADNVKRLHNKASA
jgi:integrase